ncbi:hypothetical protein CH274_15085 [Rhodococcus sp. 06-418-5]|uniref:SDR family oxidoreductase n=1 Tax=Rhodococcus sp. 06-418-5 TaxID=2022507 RepID=UPI000B9C658C|nr:hypothetical protein CH274_15085 [Rhodococcus sp. 06-418-5]
MFHTGLCLLAHTTCVASEHALVGLYRTAALDDTANNTLVNSVGTRYLDRPPLANRDPAKLDAAAAIQPLGRLARSMEIASMIVFLCISAVAFATRGTCSRRRWIPGPLTSLRTYAGLNELPQTLFRSYISTNSL